MIMNDDIDNELYCLFIDLCIMYFFNYDCNCLWSKCFYLIQAYDELSEVNFSSDALSHIRSSVSGKQTEKESENISLLMSRVLTAKSPHFINFFRSSKIICWVRVAKIRRVGKCQTCENCRDKNWKHEDTSNCKVRSLYSWLNFFKKFARTNRSLK